MVIRSSSTGDGRILRGWNAQRPVDIYPTVPGSPPEEAYLRPGIHVFQKDKHPGENTHTHKWKEECLKLTNCSQFRRNPISKPWYNSPPPYRWMTQCRRTVVKPPPEYTYLLTKRVKILREQSRSSVALRLLTFERKRRHSSLFLSSEFADFSFDSVKFGKQIVYSVLA